MPSFLLQAATTTPTMMQVIGIVTAVLTLTMLVCGAVVYAYKLGIMKRDTEAVRADAVRACDNLASEVRSGFKTVHKRMDQFDEFMRGSQKYDVDLSAWQADIGGRVDRVEVDVREIRDNIGR